MGQFVNIDSDLMALADKNRPSLFGLTVLPAGI